MEREGEGGRREREEKKDGGRQEREVEGGREGGREEREFRTTKQTLPAYPHQFCTIIFCMASRACMRTSGLPCLTKFITIVLAPSWSITLSSI